MMWSERKCRASHPVQADRAAIHREVPLELRCEGKAETAWGPSQPEGSVLRSQEIQFL